MMLFGSNALLERLDASEVFIIECCWNTLYFVRVLYPVFDIYYTLYLMVLSQCAGSNM